MNITIVQTFTDGFTTYQSGQELSVPSEVAQRWIADGKAQADTDGQQSWLSSTEVAATRALVSGAGLSGATYDGSGRLTSYTRQGVVHTVSYPSSTTVVVSNTLGAEREVTLDGSGRVQAIA